MSGHGVEISSELYRVFSNFPTLVFPHITYHRKILKTVKVIKKNVNRLVFFVTPFISNGERKKNEMRR